ncbi:MAG: zinc ABC transporter substrate-binding protein [Pseudomonadales bacterium]|nr:zinc ABC transporter substrate-binding protein [Pseudomonadales bacterium]
MRLKHTFLLFVAVIFSGLLLSACTLSQKPSETGLEVAVSIPPYEGLVSEIVGDKGSVFSVVPAGYSPETYEPSPQEMKRLSDADVVIFNGDFSFEDKIEQTLIENNPDQKIIHLNDALTESELMPFVEHSHGDEEEGEDAHAHEEEEDTEDEQMHEGEEEHDHGHESEYMDPHTWLSPELVIRQLPSIVLALKEVDEANTQYYVDNAVVVVNKLEQLIATLHEKLDRHWGRTFVVYHPAYSYFARDFNLKQVHIEVEGKEPSASQLKEQISTASDDRVGAIFLEKQFATRTAESVAAELGVTVEYVDPLAADYYANLEHFATQLSESF